MTKLEILIEVAFLWPVLALQFWSDGPPCFAISTLDSALTHVVMQGASVHKGRFQCKSGVPIGITSTCHCCSLCFQNYGKAIGNELLDAIQIEEEDGEWICFLGGNSSSGTKKYQGSNSSDGGNIRDGVKIAGEVIGSGDEIEFSEELKELLPAEAGKESDETEV
ncbi:hypothetical protein Tco_1037379 [Tanacetum coccineum]